MPHEKGVHIVTNIMHGSFCSSGDLRMHHKYTLWMFSNLFFAKIFIIDSIWQNLPCNLISQGHSPKIHSYFKTCQSNLKIKELQTPLFCLMVCFFNLCIQNKYRLFNVLCWLWNISEGAELPRVYFITNTKHCITYLALTQLFPIWFHILKCTHYVAF